MIEANIRIQPHGKRGEGAVFRKEAVSQGKHGVDGIGGWPPISSRKVEAQGGRFCGAIGGGIVVRFQHPCKLAKVKVGRRAFGAQKRFE